MNFLSSEKVPEEKKHFKIGTFFIRYSSARAWMIEFEIKAQMIQLRHLVRCEWNFVPMSGYDRNEDKL